MTSDRGESGKAPEQDEQAVPFGADELGHQPGELIPAVRPAPSVAVEPTATLIRWRVIRARGHDHLVGWCVAHQEGRISSPIVRWIPDERRAITRSGRTYELVGDPAWDTAAIFVLESKLRVRGWTRRDVEDVTDAVNL